MAFLFPHLAWAFTPETFTANRPTFSFKQKEVDIPSRAGTVVKMHQGSSGQFIVHIQDLHCNLEVQTHIAEIIHYLANQHGLNLVGVEGASGNVDLDPLSGFPVAEVKTEVGRYFMQQGKIGGPEFYAATGRHRVRLYGIEDPEAYRANWEGVRGFLTDENQGYLYDLGEILNGLKTQLYNPALAKHDSWRLAFRQGKKSLLHYAVYLHSAGVRARMDMQAFPQLQAYVSKRQNVLPLDMDSDALYQQIERLDEWLREGLYQTDTERELDSLLKRVDVIEKLINISILPEELEVYRANPSAYQMQVFLTFIQKHANEQNLLMDLSMFQLDPVMKAAEEFYRIADQRSNWFVKNLTACMQQQDTDLAVMVTGGFHSDRVLEQLRWRGISYLSIKPRLTRADVANPYFSILQGRVTPLEKMLSQNQNIMATPLNFAAEHSPLPASAPAFGRWMNLMLKATLILYLIRGGLRNLGEIRSAYHDALDRFAKNHPAIAPAWTPEEGTEANEQTATYVIQWPAMKLATVLSLKQTLKLGKILAQIVLNDYQAAVVDSATAQEKKSAWLRSRNTLAAVLTRIQSFASNALNALTPLLPAAAPRWVQAFSWSGSLKTAAVLLLPGIGLGLLGVLIPSLATLSLASIFAQPGVLFIMAGSSLGSLIFVFMSLDAAGRLDGLWSLLALVGILRTGPDNLIDGFKNAQVAAVSPESEFYTDQPCETKNRTIVYQPDFMQNRPRFIQHFYLLHERIHVLLNRLRYPGRGEFLAFGLPALLMFALGGGAAVGLNAIYTSGLALVTTLVGMMGSLGLVAAIQGTMFLLRLARRTLALLLHIPGLNFPELRTAWARALSALEQIKIRRVLSSRRGLIVSSEPDTLDSLLFQEAQAQDLPYLRLSLKTKKDLDRLKIRGRIHDGDYEVSKGELIELIENGGILLIDYAGCSTEVIEGLNSLFDREPFFEGAARVSPRLRVVGAMDRERFLETDTTFRSRFRETAELELEHADPIDSIPEWTPAAQVPHQSMVLHDTPNFYDDLVGRPYLDEQGQLHVYEGPLLQAIQAGQPLVIRGECWQNPEFLHFIRQMLLHGSVDFNGQRVDLPETFTLFREEIDYTEGIEAKCIQTLDETQMAEEPLWVINQANQDTLFSRTHITVKGESGIEPGLLTQRPGILGRNKLRLHIQGNLPQWIWHRIMHAPGEVEITVADESAVPLMYRSHISAAAKAGSLEPKFSAWDEVKAEKAVYLEGEDLGFMRARIQNDISDPVVVFPVTPDTRLHQVLDAMEIIATRGQKRSFASREQEIVQALAEGKTVLLEGMESNPELMARLSTALCDTPYLMVNGYRVDLDRLAGRLIFTSRPSPEFQPYAAHAARLQPQDHETVQLIQALFQEQGRSNQFNMGEFHKLLELREIFAQLPPPAKPGLYPAAFAWTHERLLRLYEAHQVFGSWLAAFEHVAIAAYADDPEVSAYMRCMVRLIMAEETAGQRPNTLHGAKLKRLRDNFTVDVGWEESYWQAVESLSLDLLQAAVAENRVYHVKDKSFVLSVVQAALAKTMPAEKQAFYQYKYELEPSQLADVPKVDETLGLADEDWEQTEALTVKVLKHFKAAFLRGPPGTGKSRLANEIAKRLGYSPSQVVGPITIGQDSTAASVISRQTEKHGATAYEDQAIGQWIPRNPPGVEGPLQRPGRLFIADEANLTDPQFWNFLKGFFAQNPQDRYVWVNGERRWFTAEDRIIFTGNQESLTNRHFIDLIQEHFIVLNFNPFDDAFLLQQILRPEQYLAPDKNQREGLAHLLLRIHRFFEQLNPDLAFSLRDLQELVARVNAFTGPDWTIAEVLQVAWQQYRPMVSTTQAQATAHILAKQFGVNVLEQEKRSLQRLLQDVGRAFQKARITLTESTARQVQALNTFLDMRGRRIMQHGQLQQQGLEGEIELLGKRGMIIEGPSGRGKDIVVEETLRQQGYQEGLAQEPSVPGVRQALNQKRYYKINASPHNAEQVVRLIQRAQDEGAVIIIREMNLLPSGFLEGRLNDVLTGRAQPGFALLATINSMDFSGRHLLSSAFQNRVIHCRMDDYSQAELLALALNEKGWVSRKNVRLLVNAHAWIRDRIDRPNQRPTPREITHALELMNREGISWKQAVERIYGPYYLRTVLKHEALPGQRELLRYQETQYLDKLEILRLIGSYIVGLLRREKPLTLTLDEKTEAGGYYNLAGHSLTLASQEDLDDMMDTLDHEAGHGLFTRTLHGLTPEKGSPLNGLYQNLENLRMERAVKISFPHCRLDKVEAWQQSLAQAVIQRDLRYFSGMKLHTVFTYVLEGYARGLFDSQQVLALAAAWSRAKPKSPNPVEVAWSHLAAARMYFDSIPRSLQEEEIEFNQFQALNALQSMAKDYLALRKQALGRKARQKAKPGPEVGPRTWLGKWIEWVMNLFRKFGLAAGRRIRVKDMIRRIQSSDLPMGMEVRTEQKSPAPAAQKAPDLLEDFQTDPQTVQRPKPRLLENHWAPTAVRERDPILKAITQNRKNDLQAALWRFFRTRSQVGENYGSEGALDVEELLLTSNPSVSHRTLGGIEIPSPKQIVLTAAIAANQWNPILEEVFYFLFSQGFQVTVYVNENQFTTVTSLATLKTAMQEALQVHVGQIAEDAKSRLRSEEYELVSPTELQARVEEIYFQAAAEHMLANQAEASEKPAEEEPASPTTTAPSLSDQLYKIVEFFRVRNIGAPTARFGQTDDGIEIKLDHAALSRAELEELINLVPDLIHLEIIDMPQIRALPDNLRNRRLRFISFVGTAVQELKPLWGIPSLLSLRTSPDITFEQICELYSYHPNPLELHGIHPTLGTFGSQQKMGSMKGTIIPDEFFTKQPTPERRLAFAQRAAGIFQKYGVVFYEVEQDARYTKLSNGQDPGILVSLNGSISISLNGSPLTNDELYTAMLALSRDPDFDGLELCLRDCQNLTSITALAPVWDHLGYLDVYGTGMTDGDHFITQMPRSGLLKANFSTDSTVRDYMPPEALTVDEQVRRGKFWLRTYGVPDQAFQLKGADYFVRTPSSSGYGKGPVTQRIDLKLTGAKLNNEQLQLLAFAMPALVKLEMADMPQITRGPYLSSNWLETVDLAGTSIPDVSFLQGKDLTVLRVNALISLEQIFQLYSHHPDPDMLIAATHQDQLIGTLNRRGSGIPVSTLVPESYLQPAAGPGLTSSQLGESSRIGNGVHLLRRLYASLVNRDEVLNHVTATMQAKGRQQEFQNLLARHIPNRQPFSWSGSLKTVALLLLPGLGLGLLSLFIPGLSALALAKIFSQPGILFFLAGSMFGAVVFLFMALDAAGWFNGLWVLLAKAGFFRADAGNLIRGFQTAQTAGQNPAEDWYIQNPCETIGSTVVVQKNFMQNRPKLVQHFYLLHERIHILSTRMNIRSFQEVAAYGAPALGLIVLGGALALGIQALTAMGALAVLAVLMISGMSVVATWRSMRTFAQGKTQTSMSQARSEVIGRDSARSLESFQANQPVFARPSLVSQWANRILAGLFGAGDRLAGTWNARLPLEGMAFFPAVAMIFKLAWAGLGYALMGWLKFSRTSVAPTQIEIQTPEEQVPLEIKIRFGRGRIWQTVALKPLSSRTALAGQDEVYVPDAYLIQSPWTWLSRIQQYYFEQVAWYHLKTVQARTRPDLLAQSMQPQPSWARNLVYRIWMAISSSTCLVWLVRGDNSALAQAIRQGKNDLVPWFSQPLASDPQQVIQALNALLEPLDSVGRMQSLRTLSRLSLRLPQLRGVVVGNFEPNGQPLALPGSFMQPENQVPFYRLLDRWQWLPGIHMDFEIRPWHHRRRISLEQAA